MLERARAPNIQCLFIHRIAIWRESEREREMASAIDQERGGGSRPTLRACPFYLSFLAFDTGSSTLTKRSVARAKGKGGDKFI